MVADRVHRYKESVECLYDALTTGRETWMRLASGEVHPRTIETVADQRVVLSTFWPIAPNDLIVLDLAYRPGHLSRTELRMQWLTDSPPDGRGVGIARQRLNRKFGSDLRKHRQHWTAGDLIPPDAGTAV